MILRYVPYVQTNFVLGLDGDEGQNPFALTKRCGPDAGRVSGLFAAHRVWPGRVLNLDYQRTNRCCPSRSTS